MSNLKERIRKGIELIVKAKMEGKPTVRWEKNLFSLIDKLSTNKKLVIKMGYSGFCSCELSSGLCSGCWKVVDACVCKEIEIDTDEEVMRQYAKYMRSLQ